MHDPLLDEDFLIELHQYSNREVFVKIISLDYDENPLEEISGHVTQGSISLDGTSTVRRTCSLTMIAEEININSYYWGLNTKFKVYVGLRNFINPDYPDIIWFPKGTFIISTFSTSQAVNGYTINIQGKDKMAMLNGDVGGVIPSLSHSFDLVDTVDKNGNVIHEKYLLKDIIREAVHEFAREPYFNIIINDLDESGLELLEYRGKTPMYLLIGSDGEVVQMFFDKGKSFAKTQGHKEPTISVAEMEENPSLYFFDQRITLGGDMSATNATQVYGGKDYNDAYTIAKVTFGETLGYRVTDLVYAGDLIGQVGQSITQAVLDPIVQMLGDFEYFYNEEGQFIFQRKKTYINRSWNNISTIYDNDNDSVYQQVDGTAMTSTVWSFHDSTLITSFNNNPNLMNVKNDFSIWGARKGRSGADIPIHMRYAIDKKPMYYTNLDGITYTTRTEEEVEQDQKEYEMNIPKGYQKEKSRFGLSEDWWEVRDWAKAWEYSGYSVPTEWLGKYCPTHATIYTDKSNPPDINSNSKVELSYVNPDDYQSWKTLRKPSNVDDLIFYSDGTFMNSHGSCAHSYTWWLDAFKEGGQYEGGYAYFYKPEMPLDEIIQNGGHGLQLGSKIEYETEWREIIYQMACDYYAHHDEDDFCARVREKNPEFYPTGMTGYEQYYVDIFSFWRDLFDPDLDAMNLYNYNEWIPIDENGEEVEVKQREPYFKEAHNLLYKKKGKYFVKLESEELFNCHIKYFTKGDDKCGEHIATRFYQRIVDAEGKPTGGYYELTEDQVVGIKTVTDDRKYYFSNSGNYSPYVVYNHPEKNITPEQDDYGGTVY